MSTRPLLVVIESPYAGDIPRNVRYARACMADSLRRGEHPIASHLLYTQPGILRDEVPGERRLGIDAGLAWAAKADAVVFYTDLGWSPGMRAAEAHYRVAGPIQYGYERTIGMDWDRPPVRMVSADLTDATHVTVETSNAAGDPPVVSLTHLDAEIRLTDAMAMRDWRAANRPADDDEGGL